jgi:hypothetical protein
LARRPAFRLDIVIDGGKARRGARIMALQLGDNALDRAAGRKLHNRKTNRHNPKIVGIISNKRRRKYRRP